ncbi:MAG TPA: oligosaccharide flippase family protein [Candidatus Paceibacterota bacterium]|nr:oligosaccharide flippase family protein [Candidatus Paceibacterota bacterium]
MIYWKAKIYQLLRRSERIFKTDMVYLAHGGFWLTVGQAAASLSAFVLALIFANFLTKEDYGSYKYILSLAALLSSFSLTGFSTSIVQSAAKGYDGVLRIAFWKNLLWSLPISLITMGGGAYYFIQGNNLFGFSLIAIAILNPFINSALFYSSFLSAKKDFRRLSLYSIVSSIVPFIFIVAALIFTKDLLIIIVAYFLGAAIATTYLYLLTLKNFKPNQSVNPDFLDYSKHLSLMNLISLIANQIDKVIIFHYVGPAQLAIYSIAIAIPEQAKGLLKGMSNLALPKFAERSAKEIKRDFFAKMSKFALVIMLGVVFYVFAAPFIYPLLFPYYTESIFYSQLFSISLLSAIGVLPIAFLQAQGAKRELYYLNTVSAAVQIVTLFVLTAWYGLLGAILSRMITRFATTLIATYQVKRF